MGRGRVSVEGRNYALQAGPFDKFAERGREGPGVLQIGLAEGALKHGLRLVLSEEGETISGRAIDRAAKPFQFIVTSHRYRLEILDFALVCQGAPYPAQEAA